MSFVIAYAKNATMDEIIGLGGGLELRSDIMRHEPKNKHVKASQRPTTLSALQCTPRASYVLPEHSPREA
jgi:hypothetical protein